MLQDHRELKELNEVVGRSRRRWEPDPQQINAIPTEGFIRCSHTTQLLILGGLRFYESPDRDPGMSSQAVPKDEGDPLSHGSFVDYLFITAE